MSIHESIAKHRDCCDFIAVSIIVRRRVLVFINVDRSLVCECSAKYNNQTCSVSEKSITAPTNEKSLFPLDNTDATVCLLMTDRRLRDFILHTFFRFCFQFHTAQSQLCVFKIFIKCFP